MPCFCCFRWTGRRAIRALFATPALTLLLLTAVIALTADLAHAQAPEHVSRFSIDLDQVSRLYDSLYRDRVTGRIVDSTVTYNWKTLPWGNERARIPNFLPTDYSQTREVVDYSLVPGYRAVITVPRTAFFDQSTHDVGELTLPVPRDVDAPGLSVRLTPDGQLGEEVLVKSREQLWRDYTRVSVTSLKVDPNAQAGGGIKFEIPVPMPKSLESIFGPGEKTSITIRGREEITIAGETTVIDPYIGVEGRQNQSLFPALDMEQKLDVNLTGTIGDKVSIQVDHSSEAIGSDANRVRLAYTGYEDEVIQLIELGNTNLSLPGSQLVSVSTNAQGLFGIKMLAKMGSTDITMIASKQQGEASSAQFSPTGGSLGQTETRTIRDVDYVKNKYFYIDDPFSLIGASEVKFEVYRTVTPQELALDPNLAKGLPGWAIVDSIGNGQPIIDAANRVRGGSRPKQARADAFKLLERGIDYDFIVSASDQITIVGIELFEPIQPTAQKTLAVRYTNLFDQPIGGSYASFGIIDPATGQPVTANSDADTLMLEMIKAPDPKPYGPFAFAWQLAIRNIYNLGLTNIDGNSLEVTIEDILNPRLNSAVPDSSQVPYLRIFGLDQTDRSGTGPPDGRIDLSSGLINLTTGTLQFPVARSFAPDKALVTEWTEGQFQFDGDYAPQYDKAQRIYTDYLNTTDETDVHQYVIKVTAVSTSKTFRINALDIVENSETITLDGSQLTRNVDYTIDYETGEVTLKENALSRLTPDSRVNIDYEYKPLGGIGSSTLAGFSTQSKLGENARLGTTFLYESKSVSADKPRLGEEPTRAIVAGITGGYQHQSRILTDVANWLPYVDTDEPSTIQIDGEVAASLPNPNTRNEAYIDDFEGVEDSDRIPLARRSWYPASVPFGKAVEDSTRLRFFWYNIEPERGVHRRDLNPELDEQENTLVQSMDLEMYETPAAEDSAKYAGVMLGFPGGGLDFTQGQFIELWVNDFKPDRLSRGGKLHIDMGVIDENFYDPGSPTFNDEDKNRDGFSQLTDDTGLDGIFNEEESSVVPPFGTTADPTGDDLDVRRIEGRYLKVNGTEDNHLYDTEDMDRNGVLTRDNAYFTYTIDLADSAEIDIRAQYPGYNGFNKAGHENDSWRLYRIKLTNYQVVSPSGVQPRFDEIRHMRVWFDNADQTVRSDGVGTRRLQISEFSVEGNRWEADGIRDLNEMAVDTLTTEFAIGVISTKTDPGVYNPPVNPNTVNQISDKESSLALRYTGLEAGTQIRVLKRFTGAGLNLTQYRDLNLWVHTDELRDGVEYYFRLGSNDNIFYEVQVPFTADYYNETGWARVSISLADLTNLKFEPKQSVVTGMAHDLADPSRVYRVEMRGTPDLTGVRFLYAGVRNRSNPVPQDGEIWINDIYTGDVLRNFDHAERLTANVSIAGGALSLGGNWARSGADYRGLRAQRGSGSDVTSLGMNARTDLQYFFPLAGFSIPLSGSFGKSRSLPKFPPNSDTEIQEYAVRDSLRSERVTRGFTASLNRRVQSKNFLMRYSFDRLKPNFSYSDQKGISPALRDTTTNMAGSVSYQLNWAGNKTFPLFGSNRMRWWLNSIDLSSSATRQASTRWSLRGDGEFRKDPYQYSASLRNQGSVRYNPFRSLESSFGVVIDRDVGLEHLWHGVNVGEEVGRSNNLRVSFVAPRWKIVRLLEPSIEVQSNYSENASPNIRLQGDPWGTRNVNASRNDTGRLRFDMSRHLASLLNWFGWDVTTQAPTQGGKGDTVQPGATVDSTAAAAAPKSSPGLGSLARGIGMIFLRFQPIGANIKHTVASGYSRIPDRPDMSYRLGFTPESGVVKDGKDLSTPDNLREELSYNLNSSVRLLEKADGQTVDLQARFANSNSDNNFRESRNRTSNRTWPDLQLKFDNLHEFKPLEPILKDGEFTVDYRKTHTESGIFGEAPTTSAETFTLSPALQFLWNNELTSTLNLAMSENSNETRGSKTTTRSLAVNLDLRKNFKAGGGFGFFGKQVKWTNELESTLAMSYMKSSGERMPLGSSVPEPTPGNSSIHVSPQVRYFFSRNINGSAFIDYNRSYAEALGQTTTTVRLGITALVNF
ncbi:MAG TPA: cell surface protein SprA [Candidatus Krumholzibacteria bacterium]|nr:cell surface protein SprA [Candidatus Krumholzibacteria bacterium]